MAFEIGIHLCNAHPAATHASTAELAVAAEQHGFAAVWMTEHVVVESDIQGSYGNTLHPLPFLSFLAAKTSEILLGTSVIVAPLHDPFLLAKLAAEIQQLSGGRMRLGVGAGWYEPEFRYMKRPFKSRGRVLDEELALLKALWAGERSFKGDFWRCEDARFGPLPDVVPEIWVGGSSAFAAARAERFGAVWHPIQLATSEVARVKAERIGLRVVPRVTAEDVGGLVSEIDAMREAGADGVAASLQVGPVDMRKVLPTLEAVL
jgi:probable F420-dependent oxidoreductase